MQRYHNKTQLGMSATTNNLFKWLFLSMIAIGTMVFALLVAAYGTEYSNPLKAVRKDCPKICLSRKQHRISKFGGDLLDNRDVVKLVLEARENSIAFLKQQYGRKYFSNIFEETRDGQKVLRKAIIPPNSTSTEKFRRKLLMKLLSVQSALLGEDKDITGCDCNELEREGRLQDHRYLKSMNSSFPPLADSFAKFIWTTGGHSAAAGHGNLYNESYTAFMEKLAKDVFASVGIDFIGKNYAMGGTSSAPAVALCSEAIFGSDTDVVSWDFGMTDADSQVAKMFLYHHRASLIPSRPALVGIHVKFDYGWYLTENTENYLYFENNGLAGFIFNPDAEEKMFDAVPDSFGLTAKQILAIPPYVRNFKCEGKLEHGDPYCEQEKYNNAICEDREYKASWHPGWKVMALDGFAMALFVIDALVDAAKELEQTQVNDPRSLLAELKAQEDADYNRFFTANLPPSASKLEEESKLFDRIDVSKVFKGPALCHTALLPAETRYLGYLTESEKQGFHNYDTGLSRKEVESKWMGQINQNPMRLAFDSEFRQVCPVLLNVDYKDYFLTTSADGWTTLVIPNDSEAKAYRYDSNKMAGVVIICLTGCDWGNCEKNEIREEHIKKGKAELEVNGNAVKALVKFDSCSILEGESGLKWKPNTDGKFVLRARVTAKNSFLRISTVIVL